MCDFLFQTKYTGIPALISAFDRAIALFIGPRVWPSDPFGGGSCTSGYLVHVEVGDKLSQAGVIGTTLDLKTFVF